MTTNSVPDLPTTPRQKNELLFQAPLPTRLNDDEKRVDALQTIKDYRYQKAHSIEGVGIAPVHWKHLFEEIYNHMKGDPCEDLPALREAILELMSGFDYDAGAWQHGIFKPREKNFHTFLIIDTVNRYDDDE